jgi:long-subunit acyl-CoA synthetase (AMP-forming)
VLLAGIEARIMREDGTEAEFNEVGELWLRSDNISPGYWKNDKANKEAFKDGWLRTGDHFRVDEKGYFWYGDRIKVWDLFLCL